MQIWPFNWGPSSPTPAHDPPSSSQSRATDPSAASPSAMSSTTTVPSSSSGGGATDATLSAGEEAQLALATWSALLEPFKAGQLPEKARTDPSVRMKGEQPMTLARLWEYVPFFARQSTSLTKAFLQHHLYGPPKPSWGVELTLFTTFLREVASYSHLSSLARLRSVIELGSLLPTPKDGIVTPISFRVKRRNLRGFLADADAKETGSREITGEWVTNKRLWRKMTREWTLAKGREAAGGEQRKEGAAVDKAANASARGGGDGKQGMVCLYLHGGAYYMFSVETHRLLTIAVSRYCEARVFAINYRLAPETRFPGQLHDAVSAYMRLTVDLKIPAENIIIAGDSAGGGLALATLMYLRDEGYPLPAGAIVMSPWVDLTMSCESWTTNRPYDYLPNPRAEDDHFHPVKCLLGDGIAEYLTHPYASPLFGDFTGLPPMLIQAGDAEVLRDEITLLAHKASLAGVQVEHEIFEDCVHVFQAFTFLEASRKSFQSQRTFVKHTLPRLIRASRRPTHAGADEPSPAVGVKAFDFAEVDREVVKDAHEVDEQGNAEKKSLPPTPVTSAVELADENGGPGVPTRIDSEEEEEEERLSDSTASPPRNHSPTINPVSFEDETSPSPCSSSDDAPSTRPAASTPPSSSPFTPNPTTTTTTTTKPHLTSRPILRAYASARDLRMTRSSASTPSSSSGGSSLPLLSSLSSPPPPPRSRSSTIALSSRFATAAEHRPLLHARSSSHPDVEKLLREYNERVARGDGAGGVGAGGATVRVWGAERSGRATPESVRAEDDDEGRGGEVDAGLGAAV
ncbi:hypothetical protein JCM1840_005287 [Sporobolomyces johnsonii]